MTGRRASVEQMSVNLNTIRIGNFHKLYNTLDHENVNFTISGYLHHGDPATFHACLLIARFAAKHGCAGTARDTAC